MSFSWIDSKFNSWSSCPSLAYCWKCFWNCLTNCSGRQFVLKTKRQPDVCVSGTSHVALFKNDAAQMTVHLTMVSRKLVGTLFAWTFAILFTLSSAKAFYGVSDNFGFFRKLCQVVSLVERKKYLHHLCMQKRSQNCLEAPFLTFLVSFLFTGLSPCKDSFHWQFLLSMHSSDLFFLMFARRACYSWDLNP